MPATRSVPRPVRPVVLVHGGAGDVPPQARTRHAEGARVAAEAGLARLLETRSALEAVVRAVEVLEDDPLYNAGTGACLNEAGELSLDASVMEGARLRAGAVCALPPFRSPIRVARAVLEEGRHVLYAAEGARLFATAHGFVEADPVTMTTDAARERLRAVLEGRASGGWAGGTVGAVACDARGSVAAATSTGGTVGKRRGRVGDSPIVGAGTYADDTLGAASATGDGEAILRLASTHRATLLLGEGLHPEEAAQRVIDELLARVGGTGGIILVDRLGRVGHARSTATMSWGLARDGEPATCGF